LHAQAPTVIVQNVQPVSDKEWLAALLLCFFVGAFGVHRFYTGHIAIGVIQLLTFGGCGIWVLIDLILIITGAMKDAQGRPLRK
jgi:TM2 domain-containing membrane protein YozV